MKFKQSVKYEVVVGIPDNFGVAMVNGKPISEFQRLSNYWMVCAEEYYKQTGVYVSAIITQGAALYRHEWGCPRFGETVFTFNCTANREFINDLDLYEEGLIYITNRLKEILNQRTITITKVNANVLYMTDTDHELDKED